VAEAECTCRGRYRRCSWLQLRLICPPRAEKSVLLALVLIAQSLVLDFESLIANEPRRIRKRGGGVEVEDVAGTLEDMNLGRRGNMSRTQIGTRRDLASNVESSCMVARRQTMEVSSKLFRRTRIPHLALFVPPTSRRSSPPSPQPTKNPTTLLRRSYARRDIAIGSV